VLGGALGDVPLVNELRRAGMNVVTVGADRSGAAHRVADEYVPADFSDADVCVEIAKNNAATAVVPGSNDFAAISAAVVASRLGLPGHDSVENVRYLNLKERFRGVQADLGLPHPAFRLISSSSLIPGAVAGMRFPVLVKPTDLTGGKGILAVQSAGDVDDALQVALSASRRDEVLIEEYLNGSRHGVTTLVADGRIVFSFFDDEHYEPGGFRVIGATSPSSLPEDAKRGVLKQLSELIRHLNLVDGLLHAQLVLGRAGPVLVEATRRLPGDLYALLVERATGYRYVRGVIAPYIDQPVPRDPVTAPPRPVARWVIVSDRPGKYCGLTIGPRLEPAVMDLHHAVDPEGGAVSRAGVTLSVLIVDLQRLQVSSSSLSDLFIELAVPSVMD